MAFARLEQVRGLGSLKSIVPVNGLDIVVFGEDGKYSIGTVNLNSCHAVAITSTKAALLAHISPHPTTEAEFAELPPAQQDEALTLGDTWIRHKIPEVIKRFKAKKIHFENEASVGIVVFGLWQGEIALPDQLNYIAATIEEEIGVPVTTKSYRVIDVKESWIPNNVCVLIEGFATGQLPLVWVENDQISLLPAASSSSGSTTVASSST